MSEVPLACAQPGLPPPVAVRLHQLPNHPCNYLPDRQTTLRAFWASENDPGIYQSFMDAGFRRSGRMVYQPICQGCRACQPLRVAVAGFHPNKSQRRCWKANQDLSVTIGLPQPTDEKFDLYRRYLQRFQKDQGNSYEDWVDFLYDSPVMTEEFCYRDAAGKLLGVGICDISEKSLSSVYFYHDPDYACRGLGTFGALYEIAQATQRGLPYYYLGYWIANCKTMSYKSMFGPHELLGPDGVWRAANT